jgi:hypothetical protein
MILSRIGLGYRNNKNANFAKKMWQPKYRSGRGKGVKRRMYNRNGIEINKAIGGNKRVYNKGRTHYQTIEMYAIIGIDTYANQYAFMDTSSQQYNVSAFLNDNNEFLDLRRRCMQYKVVRIAVSFNYNRIPSANDKFSKMLITPETDMVMKAEDPKINNNTMIWDMTANGSKNYNFWINSRNTEKINQEWQIGESQWNAILTLHLSSQGNNYAYRLNGQPEITTELGEMKVSILVKYVEMDKTGDEVNRVRMKDLNAYLLQEKAEEVKKWKQRQTVKLLSLEYEKAVKHLQKVSGKDPTRLDGDNEGITEESLEDKILKTQLSQLE